MSKIRNFVYLLVVGMLLVSGCKTKVPADTLLVKSVDPATAIATPEPTQALDPALLAAMEKCANILPGQACLVEGPAQVTAQPNEMMDQALELFGDIPNLELNLMPFKEPGDILNLADIQTLKLGEAGSTKGMVVMLIQTEWSGGVFFAAAFGDVELVNEVPIGTREYNPMQSLMLTTGENPEDQPSVNGFFVASPEDGNLSTLVVNGLELSFGSGGWLTSQQGGLTIQTLWGSIGAWTQDRVIQVKRGLGLRLTHEEIEREIFRDVKEPYYDPAYDMVSEALKKYFGNKQPYDPAYKTVSEALKKYFGCKDFAKKGCCVCDEDAAADKKMRALEELRKKQKNWKGGWWKMTYGPTTRSGQCDGMVVADGVGGAGGEPYTTEIPICRGNNGNTILMYDSGVSYDRIAPNLYAESYLTEFDLYGNGNSTIEGRFHTLQIVSPTRIILSNANTEGDSCTTASTAYLDFLRDDPNIRCGHIIYIDPYTTPEEPTPTPTPQNVDPPIQGQYQVRLGTLAKVCDPAAQLYAPSFTTAGLSLSPENKLVINTTLSQYELALSNLTYSDSTGEMEEDMERLGIFSLEQPIDNSFNFMMSLVQFPGQQYTGVWLVANGDGSQLCGGSIDILPPD